MEKYDGSIMITCTCCLLPRSVKDRDGRIPELCDVCHQHQGKLPEKRILRAETHEAWLREQLDACRRSEKQARLARDNVAPAIAEAQAEARRAFTSRGALAARIVDAAEQARGHNCPAQAVGRDIQVTRWADRHRRNNDMAEDDGN